jgi:hypothetical protein
MSTGVDIACLWRVFSPALHAGGMVLLIRWRVVAEESGGATFGFGAGAGLWGQLRHDLIATAGRGTALITLVVITRARLGAAMPIGRYRRCYRGLARLS